MIITAATAPTASVSYANSADESDTPLRKQATAKYEPGKERFTTFRFDQKIFAWEGGRFRLRLKENPLLVLDPTTVKMTVKDWGMELNVGDAPELPKRIVRQFLTLWSKAQSNALTDKEAESWGKIVGAVDMKDFAIQQSIPRYVEGQLIAVKDMLRVKWHDGALSFVPRSFSASFDLINEGEYFSAYVKFGQSDELLSIERVLPVAAPVAA